MAQLMTQRNPGVSPDDHPLSQPMFIVENVGLKRIGGPAGLPPADLYIDARAFPDEARMRDRSLPSDMKAWSVQNLAPAAVGGMLAMIDEAIKHIPERRRDEVDPWAEPVRILTFCAFGINRSMAARRIIIDHLLSKGYRVVGGPA